MLQGPGYPTPIEPATADLIPNDNFTRLNAQRAEVGAGRSDTRLGWRRV